MVNTPQTIASFFAIDDTIGSVEEFGQGNIHQTYRVSTASNPPVRYILQRINHEVFPDPEPVMSNICRVLNHIQQKESRHRRFPDRRWELPALVTCQDGRLFYRDSDRYAWRLVRFVENTITLQQVDTPARAGETGFALGRFHALVSDLDTIRLFDTLPGFHNTPRYLVAYDHALSSTDRSERPPDIRYCIRFIEERRPWAGILEDCRQKGILSPAVIHGDPKLNNILFDRKTLQAVAMIDLDTVKPGLIHYDIGDCLRSCCNPAGEETENLDDVRFDPDLAREFIRGYEAAVGNDVTRTASELFFDAVRLLAFELGLRFFTDYLSGSTYFKTTTADQNLKRALVQFKLTEEIERQEKQLRGLLGKRGGSNHLPLSLNCEGQI